MIGVLLAITAIKLVLAGFWGATADIPQTLEQARAFLGGADLLDPGSTSGNPSFFPLGHYLLASACFLTSTATGLPFAFVIKTPAILADLGVSLLLRAMPRGGDRAAFLYMANPVTFLLSVYHGQLHTVAMAAAVLGCWLADRRRFGLSGLALGLAASVRQHFGVLIVPLAIRAGRHRNAILLSFAAVVVLMNAWLLASAYPNRILAPTWTYGSWGYTMVLLQGPRLLAMAGWSGAAHAADAVNRLLQTSGGVLYWAWALLFVVWAWRKRQYDGWSDALVFLLGLYAISPGFGVQWLVWAVPFWLIVNRRGAVVYTALAGAFLAGSYWQWGLNARYGVQSLTANLHVLSRWDLAGACLVGALGIATWLYVTRAAWRLLCR